MAISTQLSEATQQDSLRDFQRIPGIGPSMADDLWKLCYRSVAELRDEGEGGRVVATGFSLYRRA